MPFSLRYLVSCFGREDGSVKLDSDTKSGCVFCNVSRARGFDIVSEVMRLFVTRLMYYGRFYSYSFQDSSLIVFRDRNPGAKEHLLVIPIKHIRDRASPLCTSLYLLIPDSMQRASRHCDVRMSHCVSLREFSSFTP